MAKKIRILVADDEQATCELLQEYITAAGGRVDVANDGKRALEYIDSKKYDFVFLDCNMPEMTGIELAKYLKNKKTTAKIIIMTGYGPIDEVFAKAAGADIYLTKPFLLGDIKKIVTEKP